MGAGANPPPLAPLACHTLPARVLRAVGCGQDDAFEKLIGKTKAEFVNMNPNFQKRALKKAKLF